MAKRDIPEVNAGSMADIAFLLLIFFLVTTTMDKDKAYVRNIPKLVETQDAPPPIEPRNICAIKANGQNQLMVRGEYMQNPDEISEKIIEFYQKNEIKNDGLNKFPMYSKISKEDIQISLDQAIEQAEAVENTPDALPTIIEFKQRQVTEWEKKMTAIEMYGKETLPEIHFQAHIRIEVMKATKYELFATIQSEIEEAIYELRDDASMNIFGESYKNILSRYSMDEKIEDKEKIDLLKILYPDRIIEVTPKV